MMCATGGGTAADGASVLLDHAERGGARRSSSPEEAGIAQLHQHPLPPGELPLGEPALCRKSALARFTPADFIATVEKHGIRYHEKTLGQLFCDRSWPMDDRDHAGDGSARTSAGRRVMLVNARVASVVRDGHFLVETTGRPSSTLEAVVVATGGLVDPGRWAPQASATGLAEQFGLSASSSADRVWCRWSSAPEDREQWCDLRGVSAEVVAEAGTAEARRLSREVAGDASRVERAGGAAGVVRTGAPGRADRDSTSRRTST